ncbi:hypothetical protein BJ166DRAFT_285557 [Pestalotiopsis sp. NC0098]|nr:hypothetical protein BJ166DRAFT_285557 [Pestalotiopsis sp. NC0098]
MGGRRRKKEWRPVVVIRRYSTYSILLPIQSHCLSTIPLAFVYCLCTAYHSTYCRNIVSSIRRQLLDAAKNYPMVPCISPLFSGYGHYAVNRFVAVLFFSPRKRVRISSNLSGNPLRAQEQIKIWSTYTQYYVYQVMAQYCIHGTRCVNNSRGIRGPGLYSSLLLSLPNSTWPNLPSIARMYQYAWLGLVLWDYCQNCVFFQPPA